MTERLQELKLTAFRGVPDELTIPLGDGQSLVVFGENGTGKSSIADALEWYLTGEIEILTHEGRKHAVRHVGARKEQVTAVDVVTDGALAGRAEFPDTPNPKAIELASRETFLLRGRTLADFINKSKTEKWKSMAEILGLDGVDNLRGDLQRVRTELRKRDKAASTALAECEKALNQGEELSEEVLLKGLKQICAGLGLEAPRTLERIADPSWVAGLMGQSAGRGEAQRDALLAELREPPALGWPAQHAARWNELVATDELARVGLLERGSALLEQSGDASCPLCGQEIDRKALAAGIKERLGALAENAAEVESVRSELADAASTLSAAAELREGLRLRTGLLGIELPAPPSAPASALLESLETESELDLTPIEDFVNEIEQWDEQARAIGGGTEAAESKASQDQLTMLLQLCQQIQAWRDAIETAATAARARELVDKVYAAFEKKQQAHLTEILDRINGRVAEIYESLHPGEGLSEVSVEPWTAKGVELAINFHGSRQRPPHGVLSESHLNSLAIAFFLAMAETFNKELGFLVLDDVINSFDLEHRSSLANLLANKSEWQLIVLTHDHLFFEHLKRRAPSWKKLELTSWSWDEGPRTSRYETGGLTVEARECLTNGDTNGAATKGRRALEEQLQEVCEALQALLPFRRGANNDRRELGELFKGVRRALKEHAKPLGQSLEPLLKSLEADVSATLNVAAHASQGRAGAGEVEAALERIEQLDTTWSCASCKTRIWHKGTPEAARCRCGESAWPPR